MMWFKRRQAKRKRVVIRISKAAFVVRVLGLILALQMIIIPASYAINRVSSTDNIMTNAELAQIESEAYITVVVESGDTIWELVKENYHGKKDIREIIFFVKDSNNIGSTIYPGQTINIPIG